MRRKLLFISIVLIGILKLGAQTTMSIGTIPDQSLHVNSGTNFILIPNVDDNDAADQSITFTASSSDNAVAEVIDVAFTAGNTFAVINIEVKDQLQTVTISLTANDGDGEITDNFDLTIENYSKPGANWSVYDMVFWQETDPYGKSSKYDTIIPSTDFKSNIINWDRISLSVSADCNSGYCDGHDFNTTMMSGYIIPPETGNYFFYLKSPNDGALYISTDASFDNVKMEIYKGDNNTAGTDADNGEWKSAYVYLTAGQVYAFYTAHWNVHEENSTLSWESATITKTPIPSENVMYIYDPVKPVTTSNMQLFRKGITDAMLKWEVAEDDQMLNGYNVYVDGEKYNTEILKDTSVIIEGLTSETGYSVAYTAVDLMGNESLLSDIITFITYPTDAVAPPAPNNVTVATSTGLALEIAWDEVTDGETEIRGYDVYLDGVKYNTEYIFGNTIIIKDLYPSTSYDINVVAVDAAYNESVQSTTLTTSTTEYTPGSNLGVVNAKVSISMNPLSWSHGVGIDGPDYHKKLAGPDDYYYEVMDEYQPGSVRLMWDWSLSNGCDKYVAPGLLTDPSLPFTIGDFMNMGNRYNAYSMLTISLQDDAVFIDNPSSFTNLLEYFCGPSTTTYGALRAADGYTEPLIDNSPGLVIEFGNEVWGGESHCIPMGEDYEKYAAWCKEMDEVIKSSPYYDPEKIITCYNGRDPSPSALNNELYRGAPEVDWIALSGYMGGNFDYFEGIEPGNSELEYLKNGVKFMLTYLNHLNLSKKDMLRYTDEIKPMWFYEGNMTTPYYFGTYGQALIYTDYMAGAMEEGTFTNVFSLFGGQWKIVNQDADFRLPLFHMSAFINNHCKGHVLKTELETTNQLKDGIGKVISGDPIGHYAFSNKEGDKMTIMLVNRDFENSAYVQIDLPDTLTFSASATKYVFTSDYYSSNQTIIDTIAITLSDSMMVKIPKYGIVFIEVDGLSQDLEELPLASYTDYKKIESISLSCSGGDCTISKSKGFIGIDAKVTPADAFINEVNWKVIDNAIDAQSALMEPNSYLVKGSGACGGNGTVTIRAYAPGDTTVYDDITITITNQFCATNIAIENNEIVMSVYPNPADNFINMDLFKSVENGTYSILNLSGQVMQQGLIQDGKMHYELNIEALSGGVYILNVSADNMNKTVKFLKD